MYIHILLDFGYIRVIFLHCLYAQTEEQVVSAATVNRQGGAPAEGPLGGAARTASSHRRRHGAQRVEGAARGGG